MRLFGKKAPGSRRESVKSVQGGYAAAERAGRVSVRQAWRKRAQAKKRRAVHNAAERERSVTLHIKIPDWPNYLD